MYNFSQDGITIAAILDIRKANKEGNFPIKIRVTYKRKRTYYPTGKTSSKEIWKSLRTTKSKTASELKESVQMSFDTVRKIAWELIKDGEFSFELLHIRLGRSATNTLNEAFRAKIKALETEERVGTETYYRDALSSIEKFKGKTIDLESISEDWLRKYEKWVLARGMSYSTIGMYTRAIRHIINVAIKDGILKKSNYPFGPGKYSIPTGEGRKLALTMAQIKQVIDYKDGFEGTERYRDLWFLSYLINGVNVNDLIRLKYSNIRKNEIMFFRGKTIRTSKRKKEIVATLTPEIQRILDRWGNTDKKPDNFIFPYLTGKETAKQAKAMVKDVVRRINIRLEKIGSILNIPNFTSYSARHSYATVLKRSGANIAYISESLGHPDVKTTENYLDSFESEERVKNARLLTNFEN